MIGRVSRCSRTAVSDLRRSEGSDEARSFSGGRAISWAGMFVAWDVVCDEIVEGRRVPLELAVVDGAEAALALAFDFGCFAFVEGGLVIFERLTSSMAGSGVFDAKNCFRRDLCR